MFIVEFDCGLFPHINLSLWKQGVAFTAEVFGFLGWMCKARGLQGLDESSRLQWKGLQERVTRGPLRTVHVERVLHSSNDVIFSTPVVIVEMGINRNELVCDITYDKK